MFRKKKQTLDLNEMIQSYFNQIEEIRKENQEKAKKFDQRSDEILKKIQNNQNNFQ